MSTLRQYILHRRDTGTNWSTVNTVLRAGELGIELDADSLRGKYGDGSTPWASLPYTELGQRPQFDAVSLNQSAAITPTDAQIAWNVDEGTIALGKGGIVNYLGEELIVLCRNNSNTTAIAKGTVVMFAGTLGASGRLKVAPMVADGTQPGYVLFGIATQDIPPASDGYVSAFGKIKGIDTTAYAEGTILWCDPATPGGLVPIEPQAPNLKLAVAAVISSKINGTIFVRWTTGSRLQDLHDVEANGSKSDGDVLTYVAATSRWEPKAPTGGGVSGPLGSLTDVDTTNVIDKSVLYYDASSATFKADQVWTTVSLTDGGNF